MVNLVNKDKIKVALFGLIIVAVKKESGKMIFNPLASYVIEKGDKLIAIGEDDNVSRFTKVCVS